MAGMHAGERFDAHALGPEYRLSVVDNDGRGFVPTLPIELLQRRGETGGTRSLVCLAPAFCHLVFGLEIACGAIRLLRGRLAGRPRDLAPAAGAVVGH